MSRLMAGAILCALMLVSGCGSGPKLYPVTGVIKVDGAPKGKLMVTFTPVKGGLTAVGTTNDKGEFKLQTNGKRGAVEGQHLISITTQFEPVEPPKTSATGPSGGKDYMNQAAIRPQEFKIPKETIPSKYNKNSDLMRTVDSQGLVFEFDISTKEK